MRNSNGILIKFNFFFLSIFIIYAIVLPENIFSFETLPVSEIKAGMKGYGLSVFKGVEPEKFNVEVVSVLKNEAPQRDLILVKCGGCELEKSKIIAGMSGSPVYINKKLIGAIAYAWSFSMEPLGLVTPISYMLEECENPVDYTEYPDAVNLNDGQKNLSLIKIPLMMRGASEKFLANDSSFFSKTNFIPVEFSGAGEWNIPAAYKPGAAIALQLITGDWDISAIGTITAISDSGKILAFGHPFLGLGKTSFPAATAGIHTVMKSYLASWKIGSPIKTEGSLVQDRNSLIVVDPKITAHTIKTRISYLLPKSKEKKEFNLNIASNKFLTPYLLNSSINYSGQISINAIGPKLSYIQHFKIKFNDNKYLEYNSTDYSEFGGFPDYSDGIILISKLLNNGFEDVKIDEVEYDCNIINENLKYNIVEAVPSKREASAGETIALTIKLNHFSKPDSYVSVLIYIDENIKSDKEIILYCCSGKNVPVYKNIPIDFQSHLENLKQNFSSSDIVVFYKTGYSKFIDACGIISESAGALNERLFSESEGVIKIPELLYSKHQQEIMINGMCSVILKRKDFFK